MIERKGYYKDAQNKIWYNSSAAPDSFGMFLMRRREDNHVDYFDKKGYPIDLTHTNIVCYLSKEEYPELYL